MGFVPWSSLATQKAQEKYYALLKIERDNYLPPEESKKRPLFDNLTPLYAPEKLKLEYHPLKLPVEF